MFQPCYYFPIGKVSDLQGSDPAGAAAAGTGAAAAREGGEGAPPATQRGGGRGHGGQDLGRVGGQVAVQSAACGEQLDGPVSSDALKWQRIVVFQSFPRKRKVKSR